MVALLAPDDEPHVSSRRTPERHRRAGLGSRKFQFELGVGPPSRGDR